MFSLVSSKLTSRILTPGRFESLSTCSLTCDTIVSATAFRTCCTCECPLRNHSATVRGAMCKPDGRAFRLPFFRTSPTRCPKQQRNTAAGNQRLYPPLPLHLDTFVEMTSTARTARWSLWCWTVPVHFLWKLCLTCSDAFTLRHIRACLHTSHRVECLRAVHAGTMPTTSKQCLVRDDGKTWSCTRATTSQVCCMVLAKMATHGMDEMTHTWNGWMHTSCVTHMEWMR